MDLLLSPHNRSRRLSRAFPARGLPGLRRTNTPFTQTQRWMSAGWSLTVPLLVLFTVHGGRLGRSCWGDRNSKGGNFVRVLRRLASAAALLLVISAGAGAAPAAALSPVPAGPVGWVGTGQDPLRVQTAIAGHRSKLAREFEERLQFVQADGRLRVMVATTSRSAAVRDFVARTTSSALWYPGVD